MIHTMLSMPNFGSKVQIYAFLVLFKFFPSLQLYIYPGTSVVNYVQDESGLDIESRTGNDTELDLDMLSNQKPKNSSVNHAPEPDHHHSRETETQLAPEKKYSGPHKHSLPINHQETQGPHQITHGNDPNPDYQPHQTKFVSQEKKYSEPHHEIQHHSHETEAHSAQEKKYSGTEKHSSPIDQLDTQEPKPDHKPHQTKFVSQEKQYSEPHHEIQHHSYKTETQLAPEKKYSGPEKHSSPINHQDTQEPHQITRVNDPKPDHQPHQTKFVSQENQYSEPHHEIHEHHIPHEQSKPDHRPQPTKIIHQEKKPGAG